MATDNIREFEVQVLRAIAVLYRNFPNAIDLEHRHLGLIEDQPDGSVDVHLSTEDSEHGTIKWLYQNNFVQGNPLFSEPMNGPPSAAIMGAQLSPKSLRILRSTDSNLGGEVGDAILAAVEGRDLRVKAERLVHLLLQG